MKSRVPRSSDDWQQSPARKEKLYSQVVSSSAKMPPRVPRSSDDWQQSPINFPALPVRQVTLASNAKNHHNGTENRKKVLPFHVGTHGSRTLSRVPYRSPSLSPSTTQVRRKRSSIRALNRQPSRDLNTVEIFRQAIYRQKKPLRSPQETLATIPITQFTSNR